jgi:integral membrane sensor domain MASE1
VAFLLGAGTAVRAVVGAVVSVLFGLLNRLWYRAASWVGGGAEAGR